MKQLVQLQSSAADFDKLNAERIVVFREEKDGIKGLKKSQAKTKFPNLLLDSPAKVTIDWSKGTFATYLINDKGVVKAVLGGTKIARPTSEDVLNKAQEVFAK